MKDLSLLLMVFKLGPPRRHTKGHHIALRAQIPFSSAQSASITDWDRTIVRNEKMFLARSIFDRQTYCEYCSEYVRPFEGKSNGTDDDDEGHPHIYDGSCQLFLSYASTVGFYNS